LEIRMPTTHPLAVQLYTLRDVPAAERPAMLKALAAAGYGAVEQHNNKAETPQRLRDELDEAGLVVSSFHTRPFEDFDRAVTTARILGADTIVVPSGDRRLWTDEDGVRQYARDMADMGKRLVDQGLRLGYHNHEFEFESFGGRAALEVFADALPPEVVLEVDTYWAAVGGQNVPELLTRLGDRVRFLHVKDGPAQDTVAPMTAVGCGTLPVAEILAASPSAEWHIVELDACATDVFQAVVDSLDWLVEQGLARRAQDAASARDRRP
jgi:sugar phosphate isomerase/epimerase